MHMHIFVVSFFVWTLVEKKEEMWNDRGDMVKNNFVVISLGGSLIVPHLSDGGGVNVEFLKKFRALVLDAIKNGKKFVIVTGGGKVARVYQKAGLQLKISKDNLDWVGIAATRLNAQLLLSMFSRIANPRIIDRRPTQKESLELLKNKTVVHIASGWVPGQSSDHEGVYLARMFGTHEIINASNIAFVFDKDPAKHKDAKPILQISWKEYRKLIPSEWKPGMSLPIDPVAARFAQKHKIRVKILNGTDIENLKKAIEGKEFTGTLIS